MESLYFVFLFALIFRRVVVGFRYENTTELLRNMNLPAEEHEYFTEDGYRLIMFRIPRPGATPVLLVHGFLVSSDNWLFTPRKENMPGIFFDEGYDVWMMNQRGNHYAKDHTNYLFESKEFWKFSLHEVGMFDVSASIDHVLSHTNHKSLLYVGHSMGTSALLVLCSERPQYNEKVRAAAFLAPIAFSLSEPNMPILYIIMQNAAAIEKLLDQIKIYRFLPYNQRQSRIVYNACVRQLPLCTALIRTMFNTNTDNLAQNRIPTYLAKLNSGTSVRLFHHLSDIISPGHDFTPFDYGPELNKVHYGVSEPPMYNLDKVTVPIALIYSKKDAFSDQNSILQLKNRLPNVILDWQILDTKFQHVDYLFGLNAKEQVTNQVLKVFRPFTDDSRRYRQSRTLISNKFQVS